MKFFPKLGACWGGATIAPTAETTAAEGSSRGQKTEEADSIPPRRSANNAKRAANWKPKLRVITEDGVISGDIYTSSGAGSRERTVRSSDKKSPVRAKAKSTTTVSEASRNADYYRKWSSPIPIPAFSPAPFLI